MLLNVRTDNPDLRNIKTAAEILKNGGVIIFPTDTYYAIGCLCDNRNAIEKVCRIIGKKPEKANLSFICKDLSHLADYSLPLNNSLFRIMKQVLPGPYTFILKANNKVPKIFHNAAKKTIGIRVPNHIVPRMIIEITGIPLVSSSLRDIFDHEEFATEIFTIEYEYSELVDAIIDSGDCGNEGSTVLDCSGEKIIVEREGKGEIKFLNIVD